MMPTRSCGYKKKSSHGNTEYVECIKKASHQCNAIGKIVEGQLIWTRPHRNHMSIANAREIQSFKMQLRNAVISSFESIRKIYDRISLLNSTAAIHVPFKTVESSMHRWRRQNCPPIPNTLIDFVNTLNSNEWNHLRNYTGGCLSVTAAIATDNSQSVIIGDVELLRLCQTNELFIDATFEVCPRQPKIYQFLTIMAKVYTAVIPISWALMERKTTAAYVSVLQNFKEHLAPHIQPTVFSMDYEVAIATAVLTIYPTVSIQRCYFHFSHALFKQLTSKGASFMQKFYAWDEGKIFFRKLMAIPLLPVDHIRDAFTWLKSTSTVQIQHAFGDIMGYFENYWLNRVKPEKFCVYQVTHRTNNFIEAYHKVLLTRIGSHPAIWQFLDRLKQVHGITRNELMSLRLGNRIRRHRETKYIIKEKLLKRAWELYDNNLQNISRFLACANHFSSAFNNQAQITEVAQVDYFFINAPLHNTANHIVKPPDVFLLVVGDIIEVQKSKSPPFDKNNMDIFVLDNLQLSKCILCQENVCNFIAMPCWHWLLCETCVNKLIFVAKKNNAYLRCPICMEIIIAVTKQIIT